MRPVLVGIDPGKLGGDPLDPTGRSGERLAGMVTDGNKDQFLEAFDRVNLFSHHVGYSNSRLVTLAARNLLPMLRGRRVIALGGRVAAALGMDAEPLMRWHVVRQSFVGAVLPHPSGLNRWYNDPANAGTAGSFLRRSLKPCVHVEGMDGSGKSTLADGLAGSLDLELVDTVGPPQPGEKNQDRVDHRVRPGIVSDRSSGLISELVYGPVLRGGTTVPEHELWRTLRAVAGTVTFVYCTNQDTDPTVRPGEDPKHVASVFEKQSALRQRYKLVMYAASRMGARVVPYNFKNQGYAEVLICAGL